MKKSLVQAFTIIELTITMLIAAVLIGMVFTIYNIVNRSFDSFHKKNESVMILSELDMLLSRDIADASSIYRTKDGLMITATTDTAYYEFMPDVFVRKKGLIDTFKVEYADLQATFEHRTTESSTDTLLIDEISFLITVGDQKIPYHYTKQYSSAELMK